MLNPELFDECSLIFNEVDKYCYISVCTTITVCLWHCFINKSGEFFGEFPKYRAHTPTVCACAVCAL